MKTITAGALGFLLVFGTLPARADFKYTETSQITGGTVKSMMKFAGAFSKQASATMKPQVTSRSIKGNKMRTDHPDGTIEIIDLDARTITQIDDQHHTYSVITFEQMKAALDKAAQQAQAKSAQDPKQKDVKANMKAKVYVTPSTATREIHGQTTHETKMDIEMEVEAQPDAQQSNGQPTGPVSGTITTSVDSWVAPGISGYQEVADFYKKMAQEINWTLPSNIQINPQVSQGMQELQKNQSALRGLPLLQYITMTMAGQQGAATSPQQNSNSSNSSSSSTSSSNNSVPTSTSEAMMKGLGGLFSKKKKKDDAADQNAQNTQNPPPPSTPGSLVEMTIEVNSFSDASLDSGLFAVPTGYTLVQKDPDQLLSKKPAK